MAGAVSHTSQGMLSFITVAKSVEVTLAMSASLAPCGPNVSGFYSLLDDK